MNHSHNYLGSSNWEVRLRVTATGNTTIKTVPPSTATSVGTTHPGAAGVAMTNRLVITGWHISGLNTNGAITTIELRNATTTASVLVDAAMAATTGSVVSDNTNAWLPLIANESLQLSVGGAITGHVAVTVWGKTFPSTTPLADFYDMAAH